MPILPYLQDDIFLRLSLKNASKFKSDFKDRLPESFVSKEIAMTVTDVYVTPSDYSIREQFMDVYNDKHREDGEDILLISQLNVSEFTVMVNLETEDNDIVMTLTQTLGECGIDFDISKYE